MAIHYHLCRSHHHVGRGVRRDIRRSRGTPWSVPCPEHLPCGPSPSLPLAGASSEGPSGLGQAATGRWPPVQWPPRQLSESINSLFGLGGTGGPLLTTLPLLCMHNKRTWVLSKFGSLLIPWLILSAMWWIEEVGNIPSSAPWLRTRGT